MGMYTEFIFGCELSKNTPRVCVEALDFVINGEDKQPKYDNPEGWEQKDYNEHYIDRTLPVEEIKAFIDKYDFYGLFCSCSYSFGAANPISKFYWDSISSSYHISTRADLKNYTNQIETFIDYIKEYVESGSGDYEVYAYVQYECDDLPTIYSLQGVYDVSKLIKKEES